MALLADGVKMFSGLVDDDTKNRFGIHELWYFRVSADKQGLLALNDAMIERTGTERNPIFRVHIPNLSSTENPMFASRDKAIDFINDYIRRYR
jgi:hypothetical protein